MSKITVESQQSLESRQELQSRQPASTGNWLDPEVDRALSQQQNLSSLRSGLRSILARVWQSLECRASEVQIWQSTDRWGHTWWHVRDSTTRCTATRNSENEIRAWLDSHCR